MSPKNATHTLIGLCILSLWFGCSNTAVAQTRTRKPDRKIYSPPTLEPPQNKRDAQDESPVFLRPVSYDAVEDYGIDESSTESSCDRNSCGGCDAQGVCGSCCTPYSRCYPSFGHCLPFQRMFGSLEYLMWWRRGQTPPILITTSPNGTDRDDAGQVGGPLADPTSVTNILFGGSTVGDEMSSGGRAQLGIWMDNCMCNSIVLRFWTTGEQTSGITANENTDAFVAVPFFNDFIQENDAFLVVAPNESEGSINVQTRSEVYGGDVLLRRRWGLGLGGRAEFFWGYQTTRINEELTLGIDSTRIAPDPGAGQQVQITDIFDTKNEYHAASFGFDGMYREGRWSCRLLTKLAFGSMNREVSVSGNTVRTNGGISTPTNEGFFARSTNTGTVDSSKFSFSPEVVFNMGYCIRPGLDLTFGYSYLLLTNVLQAGQVIDTTTTDLNTAVTSRPALQLTDDDFWIQGLQIGLNYQY